jgi:hypothetical protein
VDVRPPDRRAPHKAADKWSKIRARIHRGQGNRSFDRLGVRVPAILVSPWIDKGAVVHGPSGPTPTSQYEHSSIPATVKKHFDLPQDFLTKRDAWAGTFESVVQTRTEPRTDCPGTVRLMLFGVCFTTTVVIYVCYNQLTARFIINAIYITITGMQCFFHLVKEAEWNVDSWSDAVCTSSVITKLIS